MLVDQLGVTDSIAREQYAAGYRLCDNYDERVRQIDLITQALRSWSLRYKEPDEPDYPYPERG